MDAEDGQKPYFPNSRKKLIEPTTPPKVSTTPNQSARTAPPNLYTVVRSYDVAVMLMDVIREFEAEHEAENVGGRVQPVAAAGARSGKRQKANGRRRVRQCET
jgi:hypothetical protein